MATRRYPGTRDRGPMHASVRLGRIHDIEIGLNWTWAIVLVLIVWSLAGSVFPGSNPDLSPATYVAMAVIAALLFFTSLVLHELGHALVAQREGMRIAGITLWAFGGVARFKGMFPSAGAEFRIAIAGPLVSLAVGLGGVFGAHALALPAAVDGVATWLGEINLILVVFNMLPALPLDGGRVLRSVLWAVSGDFGRATRRAGALAQGIGNVLIFGGLALFLFAASVGGLWLGLIGWFVVSAARAEIGYGLAHGALAGLRVSDAMVRYPVTVPADTPLRRFIDHAYTPDGYASYPVVRGGEIVGIVAVGDVAELPPRRIDGRVVADEMVPLAEAPTLPDGMDLAEAAGELLGVNLGRALVTHNGAVAGLLSLSDLERLVEQRLSRFSSHHGPPPRPNPDDRQRGAPYGHSREHHDPSLSK